MKNKIKNRIRQAYREREKDISLRLKYFSRPKKREDILAELIFCLLTPQSRAKICWGAVSGIMAKNLTRRPLKQSILKELRGVRFKKKKSGYVVNAIKQFPSVFSAVEASSSSFEARQWLVNNVKGLGYKEASHFLRNIGKAYGLAILDRHILKNLKLLGIIGHIPASLTKNMYYAAEYRMIKFAKTIKISPAALDLVLWSMETGEVFK